MKTVMDFPMVLEEDVMEDAMEEVVMEEALDRIGLTILILQDIVRLLLAAFSNFQTQETEMKTKHAHAEQTSKHRFAS